MRLFLHGALRLSWRMIAVALLLLAVATAGMRLALPGLKHQRAAIESAVARITGTQISIGELGASWRGAAPRLVLNDLRIAPSGDGAALRIARLEVSVGLLDSLRSRDVVLDNLHMDGVTLGVLRTPDGHFQLAGLPPTRTPLLAWLLRQREIDVEHASLRFEDQLRGTPPQPFEDVTIRLRQTPEGAVVRGRVAAPGILGETPDVELHLGHDETLELRLAVKALPLPTLATLLGEPTLGEQFTTLDGNVWVRGHHGQLTRVAADLHARLANPASGAEKLVLRGVAVFKDDLWRIHLAQLEPGPSVRDAPSPPLLAELLREGDTTHLRVTTAALPLDLLRLLPGADLPQLAELAPTGELRDVRLGFTHTPAQPPAFYLAGKLQRLSLAPRGNTPGLSGLDARFALNRSGGALVLEDTDLTFTQPERFIEPLRLTTTRGLIRWQQIANGWRVQTPALTAQLQTLPLRLDASVDFRREGKPRVALNLDLGPGPMDKVPSLLPSGLLHPRGEAWFHQAFNGGTLEGVNVRLDGELAQFPFDQGEGVFTAEFAVSDCDLSYSPKWPVLPNGAGHGALAGRHLAVTLSRAKFVDSPAEDIHLFVADLMSHDPFLKIDGTVHATLPDAREILGASPLQPLAQRLGAVEVDARFDVSLALNIGLRHGSPSTATGNIDFAGNRLHSTHDGLTLDDVKGRIHFADHLWHGEQLSALLDHHPVTLSAHGGQGEQREATQLTLTGKADTDLIAFYLKKYTPTVHRWLEASDRLKDLSGTAPWQAVLTLPQAEPDAPPPPRQLRIESSLFGLHVGLPWPFAKAATETLPFSLETSLGDPAIHLTTLAFGEGIRLGVKHSGLGADTHLHGIEIALGAREALHGGEGIRLHGKAPVLNLGAWSSLASNAGSLGTGAELPLAFAAEVAVLETFGQQFPNVKLSGQRAPGTWDVGVDSERVAGTLSMPRVSGGGALQLGLKRLWLKPVEAGGDQPLVDPRALPTLELDCESFRYGEIDFGKTSLRTTRVADGQHLESLAFTNDAFQLKATGDWSLREGAHRSAFNIGLDAGALGPLLAAFGYEVAAIEKGRTRFDIAAAWDGMPSAFTLAKLTGKLSLKVKEGRFLDIDPGSGRIFGLLSVQTLPRRLSLDFSDLFEKGFAFDRIDGDFDLEEGNAYTSRLLMEGPAARVEVSGRTGLAAHDYDQRATVTPALSSSLPLAGALFGPAGLGVAAALYLGQQVFTQIPEQVDSLLSREYRITGSWQDPKIEKQ